MRFSGEAFRRIHVAVDADAPARVARDLHEASVVDDAALFLSYGPFYGKISQLLAQFIIFFNSSAFIDTFLGAQCNKYEMKSVLNTFKILMFIG